MGVFVSERLWPFKVKCEDQVWHGEDVPFCECKLFRAATKNGYLMRGCHYVTCPRKAEVEAKHPPTPQGQNGQSATSPIA